jgi:hypothetical protein
MWDDGGLLDDRRDEVVYQPNLVLKAWSAVPAKMYGYFGYQHKVNR